MSSDSEDYDGDTNWDEIVAIRDLISPRRPSAKATSPSRTNDKSLAPPVAKTIATIQPQLEPHGSRDRNSSTNRATGRSARATVGATQIVPGVGQHKHGVNHSKTTGKPKESTRIQSIMAALTSDLQNDSKKPDGSTSGSLNKGKRKRSHDDLEIKANKQQQVKQASLRENNATVTNEYDDDLSCPICLDYFLAPRLLNPCGHTVCEDCLEHWLNKSANRQCPTCRADLSSDSLPNYAIGGTVDKHIELQRSHKDADWLDDGAKWKERQTRKRTHDVVKRMKEAAPPPVPVPNPAARTGSMPFTFDFSPSYALSTRYLAERRPTVPTPREVIQISSDDEDGSTRTNAREAAGRLIPHVDWEDYSGV